MIRRLQAWRAPNAAHYTSRSLTFLPPNLSRNEASLYQDRCTWFSRARRKCLSENGVTGNCHPRPVTGLSSLADLPVRGSGASVGIRAIGKIGLPDLSRETPSTEIGKEVVWPPSGGG